MGDRFSKIRRKRISFAKVLSETYDALGVPGGSVAEAVSKMKAAAIAIANDRTGITQGVSLLGHIASRRKC
jgi:hypothetical protein